MREYKFRAWDSDSEYCCMDFGPFWVGEDGKISEGCTRTYDTPNTEIEESETLTNLMQFTGLHDEKGVEIYEGDIIKTTAGQNNTGQRGAVNILEVKMCMGNACMCFPGRETGTPIYPYNVSNSIEIIGNIYQNPELLKFKK
tara:strand:+ start:241 stop:666 length:426 start_codon:yes stop_codon:yes gene_type:complete